MKRTLLLASAAPRPASPSFPTSFKLFLICCCFFAGSFANIQAQTVRVTAAGTVSWYGNLNNVSEIELVTPDNYHDDGYDNALSIFASGVGISYTTDFHYSSVLGAVIQHVAVTNNSGAASSFSLTSSGNLGSDGDTYWHYVSNSNLHYTVSSDNSESNSDGFDPVVSFFYGDATLDAYSPNLIANNFNDNHYFEITSVPIAAGQTKRFLIIGGVGNIDNDNSNQPDQALLAIQDLANPNNWPADFTNFLTAEQLGEVVNWGAFSTLPVTWKSFTAAMQSNKVILNWSTATEQNTKDFTVQHSVNGTTWNNIAVIAAAGNSSNEKFYSFDHNTPVTGKNFYRLLQKDLDARSSYSETKLVMVGKSIKSMEVLGNPVRTGTLNVWLAERGSLRLYNTSGKMVWQNTVPEGITPVNVSHLPAGTYFLQSAKASQQVIISK